MAVALEQVMHHDAVCRTRPTFEGLPGVRRLSPMDLGDLSGLFAAHNSPDPYAHSPAYTALTARQGLWAYERRDEAVLFGWHPNTNNQIIIFPPPSLRSPDSRSGSKPAVASRWYADHPHST